MEARRRLRVHIRSGCPCAIRCILRCILPAAYCVPLERAVSYSAKMSLQRTAWGCSREMGRAGVSQ